MKKNNVINLYREQPTKEEWEQFHNGNEWNETTVVLAKQYKELSDKGLVDDAQNKLNYEHVEWRVDNNPYAW